MKVAIPFYTQKPDECGPATLRMVLEYFGEQHDVEYLKTLICSDEAGSTWTVGIAKAAGELGFPTRFFSKVIGFNGENYGLEYYQQKTSGYNTSQQIVKQLNEQCRQFGVELREKQLSLEELLSFLTPDSIPIALLNWNVIKDTEGYHGHIVPVVGYDETHVLIHQPDPSNAAAFLPIERSLFDAARTSSGTDEDLVVVSRK